MESWFERLVLSVLVGIGAMSLMSYPIQLLNSDQDEMVLVGAALACAIAILCRFVFRVIWGSK